MFDITRPEAILWLIPLIIWSSVWKGFALWRAAKDDSVPWFVLLLVFNTVGILEITYYFLISPQRKKKAQ